MFRDREEAAHLLAQKLKAYPLRDPLVLGIPRGGVVTGAVLASELGAEFDVVLSRKLLAPGRPEVVIGAIAEDGQVDLDTNAVDRIKLTEQELAREHEHQLQEIERWKSLFRVIRPQAPVADRSVIVTDDGIVTGSTMFAALRATRAMKPRELIVAVPVASPAPLDELRRQSDEVVCLHTSNDLATVQELYEDFSPVQDNHAVDLLRARILKLRAK